MRLYFVMLTIYDDVPRIYCNPCKKQHYLNGCRSSYCDQGLRTRKKSHRRPYYTNDFCSSFQKAQSRPFRRTLSSWRIIWESHSKSNRIPNNCRSLILNYSLFWNKNVIKKQLFTPFLYLSFNQSHVSISL